MTAPDRIADEAILTISRWQRAAAAGLTPHERMMLRLLRHGDFTRDPKRERWRFGTRRIKDPAVDNLIDRGLAIRFGDRVTLASPPISAELPAQADEPAAAVSSAPRSLAAAAGAFSTS
jgi:hypothetical protein